MKVSVVRAGGLAGMVTATTLDAADLSPDGARTLRHKVTAAGLISSGGSTPPEAPQADAYSYELTVELPGRSRTVRVGESEITPPLRDLLSWVQASSAATRQMGPPGRRADQ